MTTLYFSSSTFQSIDSSMLKVSHPPEMGFYDRGQKSPFLYTTAELNLQLTNINNKMSVPENLVLQSNMASVICCRAIYNKMSVLEIKPNERRNQPPLPYFGQEMDPEIANTYGTHKVLVGDSTKYHPIHEKNINRNLIVAYEYVFSNPHQIIPISSFTIKRTDHFMIWMDDGEEDNQKILEEIRKSVEVNIYMKSSVSECIEMINRKKRNAMKMIISVSKIETEDEIINKTNEIEGTKCVFLIYRKSISLTEIPGNRKNVLYADNSSDLIKFVKCGMKIKKITELSKELRIQHHIQMIVDIKEVSDPLKKLTNPHPDE